MFDMKFGDWAIVFATLLSPLLAVQAQKWIERGTAARRRKLDVFYTLMATRGTRLATSHVQALNRIELEFGGISSLGRIKLHNAKDTAVMDRWKEYNAKLSEPFKTDPGEIRQWVNESSHLFVEMLYAMSLSLGLSIDRLQIKQSYSPIAHGEAEATHNAIQSELLAVLTGRRTLKLDIASLPPNPDAAELHRDVQSAILRAFAENGNLRITITPEPPGGPAHAAP